jgi:hypothetical protein
MQNSARMRNASSKKKRIATRDVGAPRDTVFMLIAVPTLLEIQQQVRSNYEAHARLA